MKRILASLCLAALSVAACADPWLEAFARPRLEPALLRGGVDKLAQGRRRKSVIACPVHPKCVVLSGPPSPEEAED